MSIAVTSHVGRDLLQNGAYFNSAPKVVMEYVSNSIDNAPDGQVVRVDVEINNSQISIADNASGMRQADLMHFFTMHGVNRQRKRGRKVRGRFGTGKSAAFGIADGLRVETVRDGRHNVVQLHRQDILSVPDGSAIPVEHLVKNKRTDVPNGTTIVVYDLQLDKIFITPVRERLERALGRHLDMHEIYVNGRRLKYRRPEAVKTFTFDPPAEVLSEMPNTSPMKVSVAREALSSFENGVAILANGFLNAMNLGTAAGKPHTERIFGEVEVPDLDDERDDEHFPAFDNTRDLSLNDQNPRAQMVLTWVSACVEDVRAELDIEAQLARLSEVNLHMQGAADFVSELINADFSRVQRRLRVASQNVMETNHVGSSDVVEVEVERPAEAPPKPTDSVAQEADASEPFAEDLPAIDYNEPDPPDAEPVPFEAPATPAIQKEEASPDEAYESFVEYMGELDYLEEKAYHEAVVEQAVRSEDLTEEDRREIIHDILTRPDVPEPEPAPNGPTPESQRHDQAYEMAYSTGSDYRTQHVVSDHDVLVMQDAARLQQANDTEPNRYEDHWVVDEESFRGGAPAPPAAPKKYKKPQRRTYFHIQFEHMGEDAPRSRFAEEGRTIYINRDHPQVIHVEETEGVESLAYQSLMNEIVIHEYASAVVRQMASTGFYVADPFDAIETIQAVVNRLSTEAGQRLIASQDAPDNDDA